MSEILPLILSEILLFLSGILLLMILAILREILLENTCCSSGRRYSSSCLLDGIQGEDFIGSLLDCENYQSLKILLSLEMQDHPTLLARFLLLVVLLGQVFTLGLSFSLLVSHR